MGLDVGGGMIEFSSWVLMGLVCLLIVLSGFFSGSETGMMAVNRYRLQHRARTSDLNAQRVINLLSRPDRLLGMILIGNTFANILASSLMTILSVRLLGPVGVLVSTVLLTFVVLIFAEVMPKTVAALYPERIACWVARPLSVLLKLMRPFVYLINCFANGMLGILGVHVEGRKQERLSRDELRGMIHGDSSQLSQQDQSMLLGVLDLERMTVNDAMLPRHQIEYIDVLKPWSDVLKTLKTTLRTYLLVVQGDLNRPIGVLPMRRVIQAVLMGQLNKQKLLTLLKPVHFIPEGVLVGRQLERFRARRYRMGLVTDEYGDVLGLLSLEDIVDEIIGEMLQEHVSNDWGVMRQSDGGFRVSGEANIRELNRNFGWNLPDSGPNTLNGLIIESLETIPDSRVCLRLGDVYIEVVEWQEHKIDYVMIRPIPRIESVQ